MAFDPVAVAALIISIGAATWGFIQFHREGPRVRVTLKPGILDDTMLAKMESLTQKRQPNGRRQGARFNIEVAVIEVENRGRTAVTIRRPSLDFGRTHWWGLGRRTIGFRYLTFGDCATADRLRLEPFDSAEYLINANHALWAARGGSATALTVRATVQVAGKGAPRSSWFRRWHIAAGAPPRLWLDEPFDLAREVYRYLYKVVPDRASILALTLPDIAISVAEFVEAGNEITRERIEARITEKLSEFDTEGRVSAGIWALNLARELTNVSGGPFDPGTSGKQRLARSKGP